MSKGATLKTEMKKATNASLSVINIWNAGNVKLLGGILKETPNPPLKAPVGFVNLIRILDTSLFDHILLLISHDSNCPTLFTT